MKKLTSGDRLYFTIAVILILSNIIDIFDNTVQPYEVLTNTLSTIIVLLCVFLLVLITRKKMG